MAAELVAQNSNLQLNQDGTESELSLWQSFGQYYDALLRMGAAAEAIVKEFWEDDRGCTFTFNHNYTEYDDEGNVIAKGKKCTGIGVRCGKRDCEVASEGMIGYVEIIQRFSPPKPTQDRK